MRLDCCQFASSITLTSGASGSGNGSVGYSIAANTTISPRTGIVSSRGRRLPSHRRASRARRPSRRPAVGCGGIGHGQHCGFDPVRVCMDGRGRCTVGLDTSGASGTGNGKVAYYIAANPNATERSATVTLAGHHSA